MSCKCSTQTFETIQVLSPPNFIVYCPKCKVPKKKKIDPKKREIDQQKVKATLDKIEANIQKEVSSLKDNYNKEKDNTKVRESLVGLINEKIYYNATIAK